MEIASMVQRSSFNTDDPSKKQARIAEVEQILKDYPDSVYSRYLRPNLEKYKANEITRKKVLENSLIRKNDR